MTTMTRFIIFAMICMAMFLLGRTNKLLPPAPPPGEIPVGEIPTVKYPSPVKKPAVVPLPVRKPLVKKSKAKKSKVVKGHPKLMKVVARAKREVRFRVVRVGKNYVDLMPVLGRKVKYEDWQKYYAMIAAMIHAADAQDVTGRITFGTVGREVHRLPSGTFGVQSVVKSKASKRRASGDKRRRAIRYTFKD